MVLVSSILAGSMTAFAAEYNDDVRPAAGHRFFDKQNLVLFGENTAAQTAALVSIQSRGAHGESWQNTGWV